MSVQLSLTAPDPLASIVDAVAIPIGRGLFTIIDVNDLERVRGYSWQVKPLRFTNYAVAASRGRHATKRVYMHRLILGLSKGDGIEVDHINGNGLDNRRANLRRATSSENHYNRRKHRGHGVYKGISPSGKGPKWRARIMRGRSTLELGTYADPVDAALAYDLAAIERFGEFARTNFLRVPTREAMVDRWPGVEREAP